MQTTVTWGILIIQLIIIQETKLTHRVWFDPSRVAMSGRVTVRAFRHPIKSPEDSNLPTCLQTKLVKIMAATAVALT